jgi:hypothetical protein
MSPRAAGRYDQPVTKDELLAHCLSKPGAWQDKPWEGDTVVKVGPKIFAFVGSGDGGAIPTTRWSTRSTSPTE